MKTGVLSLRKLCDGERYTRWSHESLDLTRSPKASHVRASTSRDCRDIDYYYSITCCPLLLFCSAAEILDFA